MKSRLTKQSLEIYEEYKSGISIKELCKKYGLSRQRVHTIIGTAKDTFEEKQLSDYQRLWIGKVRCEKLKDFLLQNGMTPTELFEAVFPGESVRFKNYILYHLYSKHFGRDRYKEVRDKIAKYTGLDLDNWC